MTPKTLTTTPELEAAFRAFTKSDKPNIFADSVTELCEAEVRRIHACSNANDDAFTLSQALDKPQAVAVFQYDSKNALERFEDGSLYEKSSGDSTVWALASDFRSGRLGYDEPITVGMREFFGEEAPDEPSNFRVTIRRFFYGPPTQESWMETHDKVCEFQTKEEAEAAITEAESGTYRLSHNESGCPTYIITPCE